MEDADVNFYCDTIAEDENEIIYQILKAMCKFGIYTGIYFKPIKVERHPEFNSVVAIYDDFAAIRVGYEGGRYEAIAAIVMPPQKYYEDFMEFGIYVFQSYIDISFTGRGTTPEEALRELKRNVEREAPSYINTLARLIVDINQLKYKVKSAIYNDRPDIIGKTVGAYLFTAIRILMIVEMIGANVDIEALRRKVREALIAYQKVHEPMGP